MVGKSSKGMRKFQFSEAWDAFAAKINVHLQCLRPMHQSFCSLLR
jgi:hypothetical protein